MQKFLHGSSNPGSREENTSASLHSARHFEVSRFGSLRA
jgi:hypothetical protein